MERLGLGGREMTVSGHSKDFVLKVVQPSLVALMDGSVSTLAPLFATAFATGDVRVTFLVGLAAAVGAAISMGFPEWLSDDDRSPGGGIRSCVLRSRASRPLSAASSTPSRFFCRRSEWPCIWPSG